MIKTVVLTGAVCAMALGIPRTASADLLGDEVQGQITNINGGWRLEPAFPNGGQFISPKIVDGTVEFSGQVDDPTTQNNVAIGVSILVDISSSQVELDLFGSINPVAPFASWDVELTDLDWVDFPTGQIVDVVLVQDTPLTAGTFELVSFGPHSITFRATADASGNFNAIGGFPEVYDIVAQHSNPACGVGGSCFIAHPTPGCNNSICCEQVCLIDPFCCEQEWDPLCVQEANQLCEGCLADTNLDNEVNVNDLVNIIVLWSTDGNAPGIKADINKDGTVDVNDLVLVIVNWGPCP